MRTGASDHAANAGAATHALRPSFDAPLHLTWSRTVSSLHPASGVRCENDTVQSGVETLHIRIACDSAHSAILHLALERSRVIQELDVMKNIAIHLQICREWTHITLGDPAQPVLICVLDAEGLVQYVETGLLARVGFNAGTYDRPRHRRPAVRTDIRSA
ncbi:MAG: hypothetical protein KC983_09565 [Phycisphaerales bacterium]|nr:hypothetical protein [Phycisphaerales bacterium]